jgi:hypothetical protein
VAPQPAAVIAVHPGLAPHTGRDLRRAYNRRGPAGIETAGAGRRHRASLDLSQEQALVSKFLKESARGQGSTGLLLEPALEQAVGHTVAKAAVYRTRNRHHWRTGVPRPRPPASTPAQPAARKTTARTRWPSSSSRVPRPRPAPCGGWRTRKGAVAASTARGAAGPRSRCGPPCPGGSSGSSSLASPLWGRSEGA